MLTSLSFLFLVGLSAAWLCKRLSIPRIIGMLLSGVALGPWGLNVLDETLLGISGELRTLALVIILIKAGLSLNLADLKKVGRPAALMCFVPATCEVIAFTVFAPMVLGVSHLEGALMGAVLGAVSPAVVVPQMVQLMEQKRGTAQAIPQLILAGASMDDVYVIVVFTTFLSMAQGGQVDARAFLNIPISIVLGVCLGSLVGLFLTKLWKKITPSDPVKVLAVLGLALGLEGAESALSDVVAVSGLLAVMAMACVIARKSQADVVSNLSQSFGKLWQGAEVMLFVLVGAAVDVGYATGAGLGALTMIAISLCCRSVGVWLCVAGSHLTLKERAFCVIAYLPKATVQAAIGGVPLAMGLPCGQLVLSVAVVAILVTAPLGAWGMELTQGIWLQQER